MGIVDDEYFVTASATDSCRANPVFNLPTIDRKNFADAVFPVSFGPTATGVGHWEKVSWQSLKCIPINPAATNMNAATKFSPTYTNKNIVFRHCTAAGPAAKVLKGYNMNYVVIL